MPQINRNPIESLAQNVRPATPLRVAALVDLWRSPQSGGHVKGWERLAQAAAARPDLPLALTVFYSGNERTETLAPHVVLRQMPPVFSTARLKFLPYLPDHTDLAPYHAPLARALAAYDVIHTTDAHFAFSRTAERVAQRLGLGLTHSFHTDQPNYARIFTAKAIRDRLGDGWLARQLLERWQMPERAGQRMEKQRNRHLYRCDIALATRAQDRQLAEQVLGPHGVRHLRLGVDKSRFNPAQANAALVREKYRIPPERLIVVFVGRLDEGKNIYTLLDAIAALVTAGEKIHLVTAGIGPAAEVIRARLPDHATVAGFMPPEELATLYASADVLALVSEVEIRSMAMMEALASGLPVLVAAKSGLHRLFPASPAIEVVTSGAEAWQQALLNFTRAEQITRRHTAQHFAAQHIASWEQVLAEDLLPAWQQAATMKHWRP